MDKRILVAGVGLLGLLLVGYAVFFWDNDEDRIRARLDQLTEALTVTEGQNSNPAISGVHLKAEFSEIFTPQVAVSIPELEQAGGAGSVPRAELALFAGQMSARFSAARVTLDGISVAIQGDGAHVDATATLVATRFGGQPGREVRDVDLEFRKVDDEWRIEGVTASSAQSATLFE